MSPSHRRHRPRAKASVRLWIAVLAGIGALSCAALSLYWIDPQRERAQVEREMEESLVVAAASAVAPARPLKPRPKATSRALASVPASVPNFPPSKRPVDPSVDPYQGVPVVSQEETSPDNDGNFRRLRVVKTAMKYPLIRVDEKFHHDFSSGENTLISRNAMAADHVILRLQEGYSSEDIQNLAAQLGMQVLKESTLSKYYLLSFDGKDVHALENSLATLKAQRMVSQPEPDYVVRGN